jgi:hypothetical protein
MLVTGNDDRGLAVAKRPKSVHSARVALQIDHGVLDHLFIETVRG